MDNAKGEYILFLDGDDWLDSDVLERLLAAMEKDNLDCVSYNFRNIYEDRVTEEHDKHDKDRHYCLDTYKQAARFFDTTARSMFYTCCQHLFRRDIIEKYSLRFAIGIKCGEDVLFSHIYSMYVRKGLLLFSLRGYNYYHHSESCIAVNKEPWENIIGENIKCCTAFVQYLEQHNFQTFGGYELANRCWEFILHFTEIELRYPDKEKAKEVLRSACMKKVVYPYIFRYGSLRRKLLFTIFCISRNLFRRIVQIK